MKTIFYSKEASFELTEEEFEKALIMFDQGKRVYITRLDVSLSPLYIWAGEKPADDSHRVLSDGTRAFKQFGNWVLESDHAISIDVKHYPELLKDYDNLSTPKQISPFSQGIGKSI